MVGNESINEEVKNAISTRFEQVATPEHFLAYMLDHRRKSQLDQGLEAFVEKEDHQDPDASTESWPSLTDDQEDQARSYIFDKYEALTPALAAYESISRH